MSLRTLLFSGLALFALLLISRAPASAQLQHGEILGGFSFVQDATASLNSFEIVVNLSSDLTNTSVSFGSLSIDTGSGPVSLNTLLGQTLILNPGDTLDLTDPTLGLGVDGKVVFDASANQPTVATLNGKILDPTTHTELGNLTLASTLSDANGLNPNFASEAIRAVPAPGALMIAALGFCVGPMALRRRFSRNPKTTE